VNLEYTYEIISEDVAAQCMVVKYSSEGRESALVGVRMPFEGEALEDAIESGSPMAHWLALEPPVSNTGFTKVLEEGVLETPEEGAYIYLYGKMG
jgi:hypothetical protein